MVTALILNIALILLIWRRTTALSGEVDVYRQAEVRAQHMAMTDPLTNLFNRRAREGKNHRAKRPRLAPAANPSYS